MPASTEGSEVHPPTGSRFSLGDEKRRFGHTLFALCAQTVRTGKRGRPRKTLPKGGRVRLKNKGGQRHRRGPKRPRYQTPQSEHPNTPRDIPEATIHANHLDAHNAALRRRNSAFRRRTNTYAKNTTALQRTLDVHRLQHNVVRPHWTTGEVPAVRLGIMAAPLRLEEILMMQKAA